MSQQSRKVEGKSGELAEPEELAFGRAAAQIAAAEMGVKINFKTGEEVERQRRSAVEKRDILGIGEISIFRIDGKNAEMWLTKHFFVLVIAL